jgi:hypothetical protein
MNLHCWWFGCERHPQDPSPIGQAGCMRCEGYIEYSDLVGDTRHNRFMDRLRSICFFFYRPKCPYCGRRFGCDESVDHIPF